MQYTKYRISKPLVEGTTYDDIYLADPLKSDLVKFTKETPLFLRFLKLVCDLEKRTQAFVQFAKRCEDGLLVEKDAYITKAELVKCIWENGYTEAEINAFEIAFPSTYEFHYPELSVLFDLSEEDCYRYCMRQRAANPETLIQVLYKKPAHLLSSYGLLFVAVWNGLSNQVLSNAWFYTKTFPFGAVFFMLAAYFRREIRAFITRPTAEAAEYSLETKNKYGDILYSQMKKYANDARCLEFLSSFKADVQKQLANYRLALICYHHDRLVSALSQKLVSIQQHEKIMQDSLQAVIVSQVLNAFNLSFTSSLVLEEKAFDAALQNIAADQSAEGALSDPVGEHFTASLQQLRDVDFLIPMEEAEKRGPVVARVVQIFKEKEKEFLDSFTVKNEEAEKIKAIGSRCHGPSGYEFNQLSSADMASLENLYTDINQRMGFDVPHENQLEGCLEDLIDTDDKSKSYVDSVLNQLSQTSGSIRSARLTAFVSAFA